jgi:hypothetical protein
MSAFNVILIIAYRLPSVWGDDADVWNPERFLEVGDAKQKTGLGVIANLCEVPIPCTHSG